MRSKSRRPNYEPTALDIRRACERIQKSWSQRERDKRSGRLESSHWLPPTVELASLVLDESMRAAS